MNKQFKYDLKVVIKRAKCRHYWNYDPDGPYRTCIACELKQRGQGDYWETISTTCWQAWLKKSASLLVIFLCLLLGNLAGLFILDITG